MIALQISAQNLKMTRLRGDEIKVLGRQCSYFGDEFFIDHVILLDSYVLLRELCFPVNAFI